MKKWLNDKLNNVQGEDQKSLRVTLNKNFSKANLMSTKLFESSQQNTASLKNSNSTGNFPKIKGSISPDIEIKRESSPLSENDSNKISRQVKNKKIAIDDRKTNSVNQNRKEETNNSKVSLIRIFRTIWKVNER